MLKLTIFDCLGIAWAVFLYMVKSGHFVYLKNNAIFATEMGV